MKMRTTAWAVGLALSFAAAAWGSDVATLPDPTPTAPQRSTGVVEVDDVHVAPQPSAIVLGVVGGILVLIARRSMRRV